MNGDGLLDAFTKTTDEDKPAGFDRLLKPGPVQPAPTTDAELAPKAKPARKPKAAPKTEEVTVKRLKDRRKKDPTVVFSQRVTAATAEAFYSFAEDRGLSMKDTLALAAEALIRSEHAEG